MNSLRKPVKKPRRGPARITKNAKINKDRLNCIENSSLVIKGVEIEPNTEEIR